jgi:DNA-directed RNA polymerase subunit RPC12/RpoP
MSKQFENLRASELYCPNCRVARPVRERLLLVLPRAEMHEYRCVVCGKSLGTREIKENNPGILLR